MASSFVSQATATAATVSLPTFAAGDYAIVFAWNGGSLTIPSLPAGWTNLGTSSITSVAARTGYRVLQAGDTSIGTWTNATKVVVLVYRGFQAIYAASGNNGAAVSLINYAAYAGFHGSSWLVGVGGHSAGTNVPASAPAGMTNRTSGGVANVVGVDSNGAISSWSSTNASINASGLYISQEVELVPLASGAGRDQFGTSGFFG